MGPNSSIDLPAPPLNDIVEGQETYIVNECSGHVTWHDPNQCDGIKENDPSKCKTIEMGYMTVKIRNEHIMWARAGMDTDMVVMNVWNMDTQLHALIKVVEGIVGVEVLDKQYRETLLDKMTKYRETHEEAFRKARVMSEVAVAQRKILGPNGEIMN